MLDKANLWAPAVLVGLAACGEDDNGNGDTLLTGFSGVVVLALVVWLVVRAVKKRA